jgi:hypothetical protein
LSAEKIKYMLLSPHQNAGQNHDMKIDSLNICQPLENLPLRDTNCLGDRGGKRTQVFRKTFTPPRDSDLSLQVYHHYTFSISPRITLFGAWPETLLSSSILTTPLKEQTCLKFCFFFFMLLPSRQTQSYWPPDDHRN